MSTAHVSDLLPLYALGALEPDEQAQVVTHLAGCAQCRAEAEEFQAVTSALAAAVPARQPRPAVRAALLDRIRTASQQPAPAARVVPLAPRPAARPRAAVNWPMAAMLAGLLGLVGWNFYLTNRVNSLQQQYRAQAAAVALISSPVTLSMPLHGQGHWTTASGRAYVDPDSRSVVLVVENLEPLDEDHIYQAWVITDAGPQNAGRVNVSRSGWGMSWLSVPYPEQALIGVSVEPAGGSETPTEVVLLEQQGG